LSYWVGMTFIDGTWMWVYDNSTVNGPHQPGFDCQSVNDDYGIFLEDKQCSSKLYYMCMGP
ncbi:conserved oligomeric Golgi complex subunit 8, partial [Biomphalaria glabrata]